MSAGPTLILTGALHVRLQKHLLPSDGLEAAAVLLCKRIRSEKSLKLLCTDAVFVPYSQCTRVRDYIEWPGNSLLEAVDLAEPDDLSLVLIHSHPGGLYGFSIADLESEDRIIPQVFSNFGPADQSDVVHGTAIMVPGGAIKARVYDHKHQMTPINLVAVYGDDIRLFWHDDNQPSERPIAFSSHMRSELGRLTAAVVGYSGTGSIVAEQLARIGFEGLVVVDYDHVENRNLNRILNSTAADASEGQLKVNVLRRAAATFRPDMHLKCVSTSIATREAILAVAEADILFCCVDSEEGRFICDSIGAALMMPLFDVGVVIPTRRDQDGRPVILDIHGRIDYVQPGGSTLLDRKVYSSDSLRAEELAKRNPAAYSEQVKAGYMPGSLEQAPSVITVNMQAASMVVQELIARLYPYRLDGNAKCARTMFSLAEREYEYFAETDFKTQESPTLGIGLDEPLLGLASLGIKQ